MSLRLTDSPEWAKSSYSESGNCVACTWVKSSYSNFNGSCLEWRTSPGSVLVRDSQLADASPVLGFTPDAWNAFLGEVKAHAGL